MAVKGRGDYEYQALLNDKQIVTALLRIDKRMDGLEKRGNQAFKGIGVRATALGNIIANLVTGSLRALKNAFVDLARSITRSLANAVVSTTKVAAGYELLTKKFTTLFAGNEKMALAVMDKIAKRATKLGLEMDDALDLARSFIPDVKGVEDPLAQIDKLLVAVRGLAEENPEQGIKGARRAIDEAMGGQLRSIRARYNMTKTEIEMIKEAQGELGEVVGTIEGVNRVLERRGFDIEALAGTYTQSMLQLKAGMKELQVQAGEPIVDELSEQMTALLEIMDENKEDLLLFADGMGRVVQSVVEFIGTNLQEFLESLSSEEAIELAESLYDMVVDAQMLAEVLLGLEFGEGFIADLEQSVESFDEFLQDVIQLSAEFRAEQARAQAEAKITAGIDMEEFNRRMEEGEVGLGEHTQTVFAFNASLLGLAGTQKQRLEAEKAGQEAYNKVMEETEEKLEEAEKAKAANREETEKSRDELRENKDALVEEANAYLAEGDAAARASEIMGELQAMMEEGITADTQEEAQALVDELDALATAYQNNADAVRRHGDEIMTNVEAIREAGDRSQAQIKWLEWQAQFAYENADALEEQAQATREATEEYRKLVEITEEMEKAQEKMADIQKAYDRKVLDIYKNHAQKLADLDEEIAEKRVDLAKENVLEIEDIFRKHEQTLDDEATKYDRKREDVYRDGVRRREAIEKDGAKRLVKVEQDYQQRIKEINRQFRYELEDAEEAQDALAYIAAVKKRERAVEEAQLERDQTREETAAAIEDRRVQLEEQQARELEDARIGHQRQLQDLQIRLQRELDEQRINYERELADLEVFEARKCEEIQKWLDRQLEDAAEARDRKIADLKEDLDAEVLAFLEAEKEKTRIQAEEMAARIAMMAEEARRRAELTASVTYTPSPGETTPGPSAFQYQAIPMQYGGQVKPGQPYTVGEAGPELFIPGGSGRIVPNSQMGRFFSPALMQQDAGASHSYSLQFMLHNPGVLSPEQAAMTRSIAEAMAVQVVNQMYARRRRD